MVVTCTCRADERRAVAVPDHRIGRRKRSFVRRLHPGQERIQSLCTAFGVARRARFGDVRGPVISHPRRHRDVIGHQVGVRVDRRAKHVHRLAVGAVDGRQVLAGTRHERRGADRLVRVADRHRRVAVVVDESEAAVVPIVLGQRLRHHVKPVQLGRGRIPLPHPVRVLPVLLRYDRMAEPAATCRPIGMLTGQAVDLGLRRSGELGQVPPVEPVLVGERHAGMVADAMILPVKPFCALRLSAAPTVH